VPRPARAIDAAPVLAASGLRKTYAARGSLFARRGGTPALDGVDVVLRPGETLGVVGESGSGKSTLARLLMRLETADGGHVDFAGADLLRLRGRALRAARARIQMVFQDPYTALDPRQKIGAAIAEGPVIHGVEPEEAGRRARDLLEAVGLPPQAAERYPHEFSGGQRQRICIARALALEPQVLVADEAVSALDVSVQAQIVGLLREMQASHAFALMFITHDLRLAAELCDRVMVMHRGRVVEQGPTAALFGAPTDPYTVSLLAAVPGRRLRGGVEAAPI
jgi:peptide/nickel transport system ATP-binding protein